MSDNGNFPIDSEAMAKLLRDSVEVEFEVGGNRIKAWLTPLTYAEHIHVSATAREAYIELKKANADDEIALEAAHRAAVAMSLFFSLRKEKGKNAERLFEDPRLVASLDLETQIAVYGDYLKNFNLTEEDLGNYLRARVDSSKTSSNSPSASKVVSRSAT